METKILRVVKSGDVFAVKSEKTEGGSLNKRIVVLQEMGGGKYENSYVVSVLGNAAGIELKSGDMVACTLRFQARDYNGQSFQDIVMTDLKVIQ